MRRPIVAGNWKCNNLAVDAAALITQLRGTLDTVAEADLVVCPAYTALVSAAGALAGSRIALGAQDLFWESSGAFTGEVSGPMLAELGCRYVIVGHSERRQLFGETDQTVAKKLRAALANRLTPIVCVGETLAQRDANQTFDVITAQLAGALTGLTAAELTTLVLAYEPVWAIGTGRTAAPAQAQEVHAFIRTWLRRGWDVATAHAARIQYGGSVAPANALELLSQPDIDGALVGGASLKVDTFTAIVQAAVDAKAPVKKP